MAESTTPDKLARAYLKAKAALEVASKVVSAIEEDMKEIKLAMKDFLIASGQKSSKTDFGTISMSKTTRYWTNDYPSFDNWIMENKLAPSAMFEHRIAQKNMAEFLENHPGVVPPGLNSETEFSVRVSKPSKS